MQENIGFNDEKLNRSIRHRDLQDCDRRIYPLWLRGTAKGFENKITTC